MYAEVNTTVGKDKWPNDKEPNVFGVFPKGQDYKRGRGERSGRMPGQETVAPRSFYDSDYFRQNRVVIRPQPLKIIFGQVYKLVGESN